MNSSLSSSAKTIEIIYDAFVYGVPLILMDITRRQLTDPAGSPMYAPVNTFRNLSAFPDASFRNVVRPNADTFYSSACLDLTREPLVLSLPDTNGRYYMMPMLDAYTNIFASPGSRTTGNGAGDFLISGPKWNGEVPSGMKQIKSPTDFVWIIGRTQVNSKEDGESVVVPLQKKYSLTPLSTFGKSYETPAPKSDPNVPTGDPNKLVLNMPVEEYFNYMNELLAKYPAPENDKFSMERFRSVGIGQGIKFELKNFTEEERTEIENIPKKVFSGFEQAEMGKQDLVNGWNLGRKVIGTYGTDYVSRAQTAIFGLGANLREDAIYPSCKFDDNGDILNGSDKYTLYFESGMTPPANAFWSLTMYDAEGYFVDNPINRYTLGDRSNLKTNEDGSTQIYIQTDDPGGEKTSNWLPAPKGEFNLLIRVYWPKDEMLKGKWMPPAVKNLT
mgnify:FL=1